VNRLFHASPWGFVHSFSCQHLLFSSLVSTPFWRRRRNERMESSSRLFSGYVIYLPKRCGSHISTLLDFTRGLSWSRLGFFQCLGMGGHSRNPARIEGRRAGDELPFFRPRRMDTISTEKRQQPVRIRRGINSRFSLQPTAVLSNPTPAVSFILWVPFNV